MVDEGMSDAQIAREMNKSSYFKGTSYTAKGISKITKGSKQVEPEYCEIHDVYTNPGIECDECMKVMK